MSYRKDHTQKRKDIFSYLGLVAIFLMLNFIGKYVFTRIDLTSEKRFTLSPSTIKLLENLDDVVYFRIYLEGNLNPEFTRLRNETQEMLDQFRAHSGNLIEYEFIDPLENPNKEETDKIERQLLEKGLIPEQVVDRRKQKVSESYIWPGALVTYKGTEKPWQIFARQEGIPREESVNNAVKELEYGIVNSIKKLQSKKKPMVTFIEGHGELDTLRLYDFMRSLGEYYNVNRIAINHKLAALKGSDAIVIAQPDSSFDDMDKFLIDQYIMRGGKVLWMIDPVYVNRDTFNLKGYTLGLSNNLNLEDLLFKYGVRLNPVLVQDLNCSRLRINVGFKGQPNFQLFPWIYNPVSLPDGDHPIVKNLDVVKFDFASTLDTITAKGIKKTILLHSSRYSKTQPVPARVSMAIVRFKPKEEQFHNPYLPMACLLEGAFESNYKHRAAMPDTVLKMIGFRENGVNTKMIVIADGDIASNVVRPEGGMLTPMPLGYDRNTGQMFGNKTFLLNCMNYLLDDEGLLQLRAREVKLRLLDPKKIVNHETKWQLINLLVPLGIVILFGIIQFWIRRRKFSS